MTGGTNGLSRGIRNTLINLAVALMIAAMLRLAWTHFVVGSSGADGVSYPSEVEQ